MESSSIFTSSYSRIVPVLGVFFTIETHLQRNSTASLSIDEQILISNVSPKFPLPLGLIQDVGRTKKQESRISYIY